MKDNAQQNRIVVINERKSKLLVQLKFCNHKANLYHSNNNQKAIVKEENPQHLGTKLAVYGSTELT